MQGIVTFETITFLIAVLATAFSVYHFFRKPDIDADKRITLVEKMLEAKEAENYRLAKIQQNHLHTIEKAIESNNTNIKVLTGKVIKLNTIIEERLPKKD